MDLFYIAYRIAQQSAGPSTLCPSRREVYHTLNPHPALSPVPDPSNQEVIREQQENEEAYRQLLAQGALAVLLPTEDLENTCLRTLVGDILADLILGEAISGKACQGWFIWKAIFGLITIIKRHGQDKISSKESESTPESRLEKFGLVSTQAERENDSSSKRNQSRVSTLMWKILQYGYLAFVALRFVIVGLVGVASSSPSTSNSTISSTPTTPINHGNEALAWPVGGGRRRPVLRYRVFGLVSQILDLSKRMPWLAGMGAFLQHTVVAGPGNLGEADRIFDRSVQSLSHSPLHVFHPILNPPSLPGAKARPLSTRVERPSNQGCILAGHCMWSSSSL